MKRFPALLLTAIGVLALATLAFAYLARPGGTTSAQGPGDQATPTPTPTATDDGTERMRQMMEEMHGPGSSDAMRQWMEERWGPGTFETMLQNCPHGSGEMTPGQGMMDDQGMMSGSGTAAGPGMMGSGGMMGGPGR